MDEIMIRKVEQKDARSIWENIFSRNTPEEVEQRIAESIADMETGRMLFEEACKSASELGFCCVTITIKKEGVRGSSGNLLSMSTLSLLFDYIRRMF